MLRAAGRGAAGRGLLRTAERDPRQRARGGDISRGRDDRGTRLYHRDAGFLAGHRADQAGLAGQRAHPFRRSDAVFRQRRGRQDRDRGAAFGVGRGGPRRLAGLCRRDRPGAFPELRGTRGQHPRPHRADLQTSRHRSARHRQSASPLSRTWTSHGLSPPTGQGR